MRVIFTDQSLSRLEEELIFLIEKRDISEQKALEITEELLTIARDLSDHPYSGQIEPYLLKENQDHRRLIVESYKIIYRVQNDLIYILDFFNTHRNPNELKG